MVYTITTHTLSIPSPMALEIVSNLEMVYTITNDTFKYTQHYGIRDCL